MQSLLPTLSPAAPQAAAIRFLFFVTIGISVVILGAVIGMIAYALVRYRARTREEVGRQTTGNTPIEVLWTVVPTLILAGLFVLTVRAMTSIDPTPPPDRTPDVVVIGHQWWWEVHYPRSGAVAANEIHIPVGRRLLVRIESADVVHDFWVPRLTRKVDMVPGHPNHLWLEAAAPGVYRGTCAEFCGAQHAHMRFLVVAQPPEAFDAWVRAQVGPAPAPVTQRALAGARLFQSKTCSNCHAIGGTAAKGDLGPDLTHLASRRTLAAGTLTNTPATLGRWLADPQSIKPGSFMPNLDLSHDEVASLVAYLETLR